MNYKKVYCWLFGHNFIRTYEENLIKYTNYNYSPRPTTIETVKIKYICTRCQKKFVTYGMEKDK